MAEIMLLILFMLLLTLGVMISDRELKVKDLTKKLARYTAVEQFLSDLTTQSSGMSVTDIVQRIERQQRKITELNNELAQLRPLVAAGKALQDIVREINNNGKAKVTAADIVKKLNEIEKLRSENATLRGQVAQLTNQIRSTGKGGNEFPSCWVTADGKTQSIFELTLGGGGIAIREHPVPDRAADRQALPIQSIPYGQELSASAFVGAVTPLYNWSVTKGCRFYVIRYSSLATAPIEAINRISSMFYPDSSIMRTGVTP
jgi:hypothetical protein